MVIREGDPDSRPQHNVLVQMTTEGHVIQRHLDQVLACYCYCESHANEDDDQDCVSLAQDGNPEEDDLLPVPLRSSATGGQTNFTLVLRRSSHQRRPPDHFM